MERLFCQNYHLLLIQKVISTKISSKNVGKKKPRTILVEIEKKKTCRYSAKDEHFSQYTNQSIKN